MTKPTKYPQCGKGHEFNVLRREILLARLKVALGGMLGRTPSPMVTRLFRMKLTPIVGRHQRFNELARRRRYDPTNKDQIFDTLRREILAAQLKVTLDKELGRETSPVVQRLAQMKLPPVIRPMDRDTE